VAGLLRERGLHTVCTSAKCPNIGECWARGTATIMILGKVCTRGCRFCSVATDGLLPPDPEESARVAEALERLGLKYAVITSVTRDDLPDGGATHFAATVQAIRAACFETKVELLIPDFGGDLAALDVVLSSAPDVVGHNLETVRRLTPKVRHPRADYDTSLSVLKHISANGTVAKTALLLGLGETLEEVHQSLEDAFGVGVRRIALGQYLAPSSAHAPVERYWTPAEFDALADTARRMGYTWVASGPLVRSSYKAEE